MSLCEGCSKVSIDVAWIVMGRCKCQWVALDKSQGPHAMYVGQVLSDLNSQSITSRVSLVPSNFEVDRRCDVCLATQNIHIVGLITYTCRELLAQL